MTKIRQPFNIIPKTEVLAGDAALPEVAIEKSITYVEIIDEPMGAARTLNLNTAKADTNDILIVRAKAAGGTRELTFGTGITADNLSVGDGDTKSLMFVFNGTEFVPGGAVLPATQMDITTRFESGAGAVTIAKLETHFTVIDLVATPLTGNRTLTITAASVQRGAILIVEARATGAARTLTLAGIIQAGNVVIQQNTNERVLYIFDGTNFVPYGRNLNSDYETITASGAGDVTIASVTKKLTIVDIVATPLTDDRTINVTAATCPIGSILQVRAKAASSGAPHDLTFGTNISADKLEVTADKTEYATFFWDGSNFVPFGAEIQID